MTTERLTVTLPADVAARLRRTVAEDGYATAGEVVREALEDWAFRRDEEADADRLRQAARAGLESGPPLPAQAVLAELRARYAPKA